MVRTLLAAALVALGFAAVLAGRTAVTGLVLVVAVAVLVDLSQLLARASARPVLPAALVAGLALPAVVAGDPAAGWDRIPSFLVLTFLVGFALVLVVGRRAGAVAALSSTAVAALVVGLGASSVLVLRGLPDGLSWLLAVGLLVVAADAAGPFVRAVRRAQAVGGPPRRSGRRRTDAPPAVSPAGAIVPPVVAVAIAGVLLWLVLGPPLEPLVLVGLGLIAVVAALVGGFLERTLVAEAVARRGSAAAGVGSGLLVGVTDALLLAAPAAAVFARSVAL